MSICKPMLFFGNIHAGLAMRPSAVPWLKDCPVSDAAKHERRSRRARGDRAESAAAAHLEAAGWRIVGRNWHDRFGEIDLIASREGLLAFVEVKARRDARYGGGLAAVTWRKRRRMIHAARSWLARHGHGLNTPCRFDVIEVALQNRDCKVVRWVPNAFGEDWQ